VFLLWPAVLAAEEIIKSVDAQGRVSYGTRPAVDAVSAEAVPVDPGPSLAERNAAQERLQRQQAYLEELTREREARQQQAAAEQSVPGDGRDDRVSDADMERGYYPYGGGLRPPGLRPPQTRPPGDGGDLPIYRPRPPLRPAPPKPGGSLPGR
jgi:hypothetical protein